MYARSLLRRVRARLSGGGSGAVPDPHLSDAQCRVSELWGRHAAESGERPYLPGAWTSHPIVRGAMNRRISGREDMEWLAWARWRFFPNPASRVLSLGCGGGLVEREAVSLGLCQTIEGVDLSAEAIAVARRRAADGDLSGITYRVADLNSLELAPASYDIVICKQALHHVERLEHLLDQVRQSLRPGGWFLVNEYVGPSRFQWTDVQLGLMNELLMLLPERLRRLSGGVRERIDRLPAEVVAASDPSEAVRSGEIAPLLLSRFELVERRDFGGTLLHPLLAEIIANFDPANESEATILRLLIAFEDALLGHGVLTSDFAVFILRRA